MTIALIRVASLALAVTAPTASQGPDRTWIADVNIISPERLDRVERGSVLIENGRIARVERRDVAPPAGVTIVRGNGRFLIPGLIDSHVHLTLVPGMDQDQAAKHPEIVNAYFQQLPRAYLYFGYTTLIDLGVAVDHQRLDSVSRAPQHPDVYTCGDAVVLLNGYPTSFYPAESRLKLFPNFLHDSSRNTPAPPGVPASAHTPAAAVAAVKRSGGICVKTFFERGFERGANAPVIDSAMLAGLRAGATAANLTLVLHANTFEAQQFGVAGNVDVLAHGMWRWGALDAAATLPAPIVQLLDTIVARRIGYQPTIQVNFAQSAYFDSTYLRLPAIGKVVPPEMVAWFRTAEGRAFKGTLGGNGVPDEVMLQRFENGPLRRVRAVVGYLATKHANFLFGTDTPSMPSYGSLPGLNDYLEMRQLRKAGLSLAQILRAATLNNAREFKIDSQVGTIEAGKVANLVLLARSPLESVEAYDSIVTVWVHGQGLARESLVAGGAGR